MAESSATQVGNSLKNRERIIERLINYGIPMHQFGGTPCGLVNFMAKNKSMLSDVVSAIIPSEEDISYIIKSFKMHNRRRPTNNLVNALFAESFLWLQWLMFEDDPQSFLKNMEESHAGQRSVCGAVWGLNELAYKCRTCQHDPTCAICVPCFKDGNHDGHDFSIINTGGGCCDCGDSSAWKPQGFCSKHKGVEKIQPLSPEIASSLGPVIDAVFHIWNNKLAAVGKEDDVGTVHNKAANALSNSIADLLLMICKCSESILTFVTTRICASVGLLNMLMRSERFLGKHVCQKIHDLLLMLLAEPQFKYDFAKGFIKHYSYAIHEDIKKGADSNHELYPLILGLSVQIFTVPTLALLLVQEHDLLGILLGCLEDLFCSCTSGSSYIQINKWINFYQATIELIRDIHYVIRDKEVRNYIATEQPDFYRAWFRILSLVQGMDPQIRVTSIPLEDQREDYEASFHLGKYLWKVNKLLVEGAVSSFASHADCLDDGLPKYEKIERTAHDESKSSSIYMSSRLQISTENVNTFPIISSTVQQSISECLEAIEIWLCKGTALKTYLPAVRDSCNTYNFHNLEKGFLRNRNNNDGRKNCILPILSNSTAKLARHHECCKSERPVTTCEVSASCKKQKGENLAHSSNSKLKNNFLDIDYEGLEVQCKQNTASWPEIKYDVSSQEVSFHIPLHRFLSVLLQSTMEYCYGSIRRTETASTISSAASYKCLFFEKVLDGFDSNALSAYLMEQPLSLRVYCAQVRAGLWRKNGEVPLDISEYYHNCRTGIEVDLFLMQCCAALAPPDLFVTRILERFGLIGYLSLSNSVRIEYEPILVQEMLSLIIQIVKERRYCGLSMEENLQRELLHKLVTGDATHSQLVDALPHDLSKHVQLQNILDTLADYIDPSTTKQGKYTLKYKYWKQLDLYHPRWNSRDLQIAEERYTQFCKVSPLSVQLPSWMHIFSPLEPISRIATSKTVLKIVRAVIFYALSNDMPSVSCVSDGVVSALHLLALSLDICEKQKAMSSNFEGSCNSEGSFPVLMLATEDIGDYTDGKKHQTLISMLVSLMRKYRDNNEIRYPNTNSGNLSSLIECLLKKYGQLDSGSLNELKHTAPEIYSPPLLDNSSTVAQKINAPEIDEKKAKARAHQAAILEKMRAEQLKFISSIGHTSDNNSDLPRFQKGSGGDVSPVCSLCREDQVTNPKRRLCFFVHVQKSRLATLVDNGPQLWESNGVEHQYVSNDTYSTSDSVHKIDLSPFRPINFQDDNAFLRYGATSVLLPDSPCDAEMSCPSFFAMVENDRYFAIEQHIQKTSSFGPNSVGDGFKYLLTFVNEVLKDNRNTPASIFDDVLRCLPGKHPTFSLPDCFAHAPNAVSSSGASYVYHQHGAVDCDGIYISSCGHAVHKECYTVYLSSLKQRSVRRIAYEGGHIADPHKDELLCPVCRGFSNSILPDLADVYNESKKLFVSARQDPEGCPGFFKKPGSDCDSSHLQHALSLLRGAAETAEKGDCLADVHKRNMTVKLDFDPVVKKLCKTHRGHDDLDDQNGLCLSSMLWDSLRYSLVSCEISVREKASISSEYPMSRIEALVDGLDSSTRFTMSLLMLVSQVARSLDYFQIQLRFEGIKHFADSICDGVSSGSLSSGLDHAVRDEGPANQFWKFASDPILAYDAFTSLMWLIFSLPTPFMSSAESFVSLVHLFYVVSIIQALITCHSTQRFSSSCFSDSPLNDFCRTMGEIDLFKNYFVSNYIDSSSSLKDMVRRLTIPFLRRCALLWKLSMSSTHDYCGDCQLNTQPVCYATKMNKSDTVNYPQLDLNEASVLEKMFQLRSIDVIIHDVTVQCLAFNWCKHFYQTIGAVRPGRILFCSPAVPFTLIPLPLLYQELLQRYIKQKCPDWKSVIHDPILCLVCGKLCSFNGSSSLRMNQSQSHALSCGAGIGVFLLLRRTIILLQRSARQTFWPSPYLDAFGEEDVGLSRGRPLYLNKERYATLADLVSSHKLD